DVYKRQAREGLAEVEIELLRGVNEQKAYQDIKQEIDRITTFPLEAEEPQVTLDVRRREVVVMQLYGNASEWVLRNLAEDVRDRLLQSPDITQVELTGGRAYEVQVEVPRETLRAYGLTLEQLAQRIRMTALELPGGRIQTEAGEILLRLRERREWASEFAELPVVTTREGGVVTLGQLATVREGFEDVDRVATYNGLPAIRLEVYRVGRQTPIGVSDAVRELLPEIRASLPPGVGLEITTDWSDVYRQRLQLLLKNAFFGLVLVMGLLGLFLEFKLAAWVMMGIPTAFLGTLLFLPMVDVSINMISMFAFIIALGIVVDDAIVAGENIYNCRQQGMDRVRAAIVGARAVAVPVAFSVLTNVVAFVPLFFVPGMFGKIWQVIPLVVITAFLISWMESLLILPAHLAHTRSQPRSRLTARLHEWQQQFAAAFDRWVQNRYGRFLEGCLRHRYVTLAVSVAVLVVVIAYVVSGRIGMILMPRVEADQAAANVKLPVGSPMTVALTARDQLVRAAERVAAEHGGERLLKGVFALVEGDRVEVVAYLTDADVRPIGTAHFTRLWRERTGALVGVDSVQFAADRGGPGAGAALSVELSHRDVDVLERASRDLASRLTELPVVKDIDAGFRGGKPQLDFVVTEAGRSLGLTSQEVARQIRHAFYGAEALRQQRGRNETKVMVRLPAEERASEYDVEHLMVRVPSGADVPLVEVAEVRRGRAYTTITRRDGRRTVTVTGDVEPLGETPRVLDWLKNTEIPALAADYPRLTFGYQGQQADLRESVQSLQTGLLLALMGIFFLLAVPFRSYVQPLIVMTSIPFGIVGAVLGHVIMGYDLSVLSLMGIIALAGVVVNAALVLIVQTNENRAAGMTVHDAVWRAAIRRFRPIMLTTLTTFGGLAPMIFETSRQARFMIPMALSLGYGILFATAVSLVIVPALYLILEDVKGWRASFAQIAAMPTARAGG
ncbi:MAG: efflux RND transporter permease subunit, partial [Verrucomicrobiae bacterium]|nr:efflux RND transporter permease subunit [Verrucomicrobiae bacterium]